MCLIAWHWSPDSVTPLVWAANRDEFAHRATAPMQAWSLRQHHIVSGLDLALEPSTHSGGRLWGTWAGMNTAGQFAWLTNIRNPQHANPHAPSRGLLVSRFLASDDSPETALLALQAQAHRYNGFNLVLGQLKTAQRAASCWHFNSATGHMKALPAGVYGLSNADLDTPWPKTRQLVQAVSLQAAALWSADLNTHTLFTALGNHQRYGGDDLPETGIPIEIEHVLSSAFIAAQIRGNPYGTRSSTVGWVHAGTARIEERSFDAQGLCNNTIEHTLTFD